MINQTEYLSPAILNQFADLLHERRSEIAPPLTRNSKSMYDLWMILHEREVSEIDSALARIRNGSYGICRLCGAAIQFLHLYQHPASECCLTCRPKDRTVQTA